MLTRVLKGAGLSRGAGARSGIVTSIQRFGSALYLNVHLYLPVLDEDGVACGRVSQRDLFRSALLRSLGYGTGAEDTVLAAVAVKEVMSEDLVSIGPNADAAQAASIMPDKQVGCLPVIDGGRLVGLLSESPALRAGVLAQCQSAAVLAPKLSSRIVTVASRRIQVAEITAGIRTGEHAGQFALACH
jgi:predicted transcriptional regulator